MQPVVVCVIGTRPEAIKMAPLILRLRRDGSGMDVRVLTTGQHRGLLDQALADFAISADHDLGLMRPDQGLADLMGRALAAISAFLDRERPALVLAQGDTTTVLATALACYYNQVPFGHVEAGLRTWRPFDPFPEEKNRVLASHLAEIHFAPTSRSRLNLLKEGIADSAIHVTGNTIIDALKLIAGRPTSLPVEPATPRFLLATMHRRENFGAPLERICLALADLIDRNPTLSLVVPVHPNPRARDVIVARLGGRDRAHLIEPTGYFAFVALMKASTLILTDSGGVQEEGPSLGKPVLVLRDTTERPEAVAAGTVRLIGTERAGIVAAVEAVIAGPALDAPSAVVANSYGDGWAAERIARVLADRFELDPGPLPADFPPTWPPA